MEASRIIWNLFVLANTSTAAQYGVHAIAFFLSPCLSARMFKHQEGGTQRSLPTKSCIPGNICFPRAVRQNFLTFLGSLATCT